MTGQLTFPSYLKYSPHNQSFVLLLLSMALQSIGPKLIKAALEQEPPSSNSRTRARLRLIVAAAKYSNP